MSGDALDPAAQAAAIEVALARARASNIALWTLYATGVLIMALRTYARVKAVGWRRFEADDYLAWLALVLYTIQSTLGFQIGNLAQGLANNAMTPDQRAALLPSDPEYGMRVIGSKIQIASWTFYSTLMAVLKFAMLFFYLRLVNGLGRRYRQRVHIGFALVLAGYLASIGAVFLSCIPFHKYWRIHPDPGNFCEAAVSRPVVWASYTANVTSDIYLIVIPLPLLWGSRLRLIEEIASTLVLSADIFVLACATVKTAFIVTDDIRGGELAGAWGTREAFVAVATTNLPMVFPLLKTWLRPLIGSSPRNTDKQYKTPDGGFRSIGGGVGIGGGGGCGNDSRRRETQGGTKGTVGTNPLTTISFNDSEERIVNEIKMQNMRGAATAAVATGPEGQGQGQAPQLKDARGILVITQFDVSEDRGSQHEQHLVARVHEPW